MSTSDALVNISWDVDTFYKIVLDNTRSKENVLAELDRWANQSANDAYEEELQERAQNFEDFNNDGGYFERCYLSFYLQCIERTIALLITRQRRFGSPVVPNSSPSEMERITKLNTFLLRYIWDDSRKHFTEYFLVDAMEMSDRLGADDLLRSIWSVYQKSSPDTSYLGQLVRCLRDNAVRDEIAGQLLDQIESMLALDPVTIPIQDVTQARQLLDALERPDALSAITKQCLDPLRRRSVDLFVRLVNHNYQQIGRIDLEHLERSDNGERDPYENQTDFEKFKSHFDYQLRQCIVGDSC